MNEIIFLVEYAPEGGYTARALGESIFTKADDTDSLSANIREAVDCHFEPEEKPKLIRLHYTNKEIWDSIAAEADETVDVTPEQRTELERRMEDFQRDSGGGIPWETIRAEALTRN